MSRDAQTRTLLILTAALVSSIGPVFARPSATLSAKSPPTRLAMAAPVGAKPPRQISTTIAAVVQPRPDMLYAVGEGAMPTTSEQPNRAKAYLQAKSYAKMAAIASLLQEVKGTVISYCSTGQGYSADALVKQEVKGALECIQVVAWRKRAEGKDTIVEVTVRAPRPAIPIAAPVEAAVSKRKPVVPSWVRSDDPVTCEQGEYTSLVIDALGLDVRKSMSPKILRPDGSEVWGTVKADLDFVTEHGIVAYAKGRSEALANRRAGENPLMVRARCRGSSQWTSDVVISDFDADRILEADAKSGFLGDFRVIMIVDR